jgi:hypothetical protein
MLLYISIGNIAAWAGENTVTVETQYDAPDADQLTGTATFTVINYKLTVSIEPIVIVQDDEITINVEITPAIAAEIEFGNVRFPPPVVPFKTDDGGRLKATLSTKGVDLGYNNTLWTIARVPLGNDFINVIDIQVFYGVNPFVEVFTNPDPATVGNIITASIRTFYYPDVPTKLDITVINESGYKQSFSTETEEDGRLTLPILELDLTNIEVWAGDNTVKVKASLPSGKKMITAESSFPFFVNKP